MANDGMLSCLSASHRFRACKLECVPQITSKLYDHVWERWCTDTRSLLESLPATLASGGSPSQAVGQALERWLLLLKVPCTTAAPVTDEMKFSRCVSYGGVGLLALEVQPTSYCPRRHRDDSPHGINVKASENERYAKAMHLYDVVLATVRLDST